MRYLGGEDVEGTSPRAGAAAPGGSGAGDERKPLIQGRGGEAVMASMREGRRDRHAAFACLLSVAVALTVKGAWLATPAPSYTALLASTRLHRAVYSGTHVRAPERAAALSAPQGFPSRGRGFVSLAGDDAPTEPDEDHLRGQMGRGWVTRYDDDPLQGSTSGGPGMPLAASSAKSPEELKGHQFHRVFKQRNFRCVAPPHVCSMVVGVCLGSRTPPHRALSSHDPLLSSHFPLLSQGLCRGRAHGAPAGPLGRAEASVRQGTGCR